MIRLISSPVVRVEETLGGTGSAKSTLIQMIPRLYDATQGSVRVGGADVREYDLNVLREQVAVVPAGRGQCRAAASARRRHWRPPA